MLIRLYLFMNRLIGLLRTNPPFRYEEKLYISVLRLQDLRKVYPCNFLIDNLSQMTDHVGQRAGIRRSEGVFRRGSDIKN
jgi:hypothetical protein